MYRHSVGHIQWTTRLQIEYPNLKSHVVHIQIRAQTISDVCEPLTKPNNGEDYERNIVHLGSTQHVLREGTVGVSKPIAIM